MRLVSLALLLAAAPVAFAQAGTLDPTFGIDGVVRFAIGPGHLATDIVALPDGRALVSGAEAGDAVVYRLDAAGALDPSFGDAGVARLDYGGTESAASLVVAHDGRIVVAVDRPQAPEFEKAALVALTPDGALDTSFGTDGLAVVAGATWRDLGLDPDGRLVGLLAASFRSIALRFSADGVLDESYGDQGVATFFDTSPKPGTSTSYLDRLALDDQGRAVAAGVVAGLGVGDPFGPVVARLTADGDADPTFGDGGAARLDLDGGFPVLIAVTLDDAGRILAAGFEDVLAGAGLVVRLAPDGQLDPTFADGGVARVAPDVPLTSLAAIALQPDGKILAAGAAGTTTAAGFVAARRLPDGALDPAFGIEGVSLLTAPDGDIEVAFDLALAPDGDVWIAGARRQGAETDRAVVARLRNDLDVATVPTLDETPFALAHAGSNPSAAGRVSLRLHSAQPVRLSVHDALGRTVAVLHDGALAAGPSAFTLGALAPGVYLVRAVSEAGQAELPVTIVR